MIRQHLARLALALSAIGFFAGTSVVVASGAAQAATGHAVRQYHRNRYG